MDINFELYKIFYIAAKSESFTSAADKLYISQSAVSQAVKSLERKMGCQLFSRGSRNVKLTVEGELLFSHVEQAYNFIKTAESKISQMQDLSLGEIRIGASDTVCRYHLMPSIQSFNRNYHGIKIQLINRTSSQILATLKRGLIDFGIVTLPISDPGIMVEEFIKVQDIFVASDRFKELKGSVTNLKKLSGYPLLMLQKNSATRQNIDGYLCKKGIFITPEMELESVDLLVDFAKIGLGIACVLEESAAYDLEKGNLFQVATTEKLLPRKLGIVTAKNVPPSRASTEFIAFIKKHFTA